LVSNHGLAVAIVVAVICIVVALGVFLPDPWQRSPIVVAVVTGAVIWVVGQNFGLLFPGSATDPNSGPLLILLALAYWPPRRQRMTVSTLAADATAVAIPAGAA
jgi:predicted RND superfamily exporter protein